VRDNEVARLPIGNVPAPDDNPKGTMLAEELNRIADGAESAIREQERRGKRRSAAQTADAVERQRLIIEIRAMRRYRLNVAVDGLVGGVLFAGVAVGLYHLGRWVLGELRRTPSTPAASSAVPPYQPTPPYQSPGAGA
jgi:hypothetical protein